MKDFGNDWTNMKLQHRLKRNTIACKHLPHIDLRAAHYRCPIGVEFFSLEAILMDQHPDIKLHLPLIATVLKIHGLSEVCSKLMTMLSPYCLLCWVKTLAIAMTTQVIHSWRIQHKGVSKRKTSKKSAIVWEGHCSYNQLPCFLHLKCLEGTTIVRRSYQEQI